MKSLTVNCIDYDVLTALLLIRKAVICMFWCRCCHCCFSILIIIQTIRCQSCSHYFLSYWKEGDRKVLAHPFKSDHRSLLPVSVNYAKNSIGSIAFHAFLSLSPTSAKVWYFSNHEDSSRLLRQFRFCLLKADCKSDIWTWYLIL